MTDAEIKAKKVSKKAKAKAVEAEEKPVVADSEPKKVKKSKKSTEEPSEEAKEKASMAALEAAEKLATKRKAEGGEDGAGAPKKKKRRKGKAAREAAAAGLNDEEKARREAQRELQRTVVQMKKEGKTSEEIFRAKRRFNKTHSFRAPKTQEKREEIRDIKKQKQEIAHEKGKEHELVIIPIAWKRHQDEKGLIDGACERVKQRLMAKGVNAWIDKRTLYTPGQKFAYWEHIGVMLRVEIGPKDIETKTCTISKAQEAGKYQTTERHQGVSLSGADLLHRLKGMGLDGLQIDADDEDFEDGATQAEVELKPAQGGDDDAENFVLKADSEQKDKKKRKRF